MSVTFITTWYNENPTMFIGSLLNQTNPNWKAILYHNGPISSEYKAILDLVNDKRITYTQSTINTGYWGCYNRIEALKLVDTEYVINTSIQDYFIPQTVNEILLREEDFIYWNSLHHYFGHNILDCEPQPCRIDWGNFATKTSIAQQIGISKPEHQMADWVFVDDVLKSELVITRHKINKVLTIKN